MNTTENKTIDCRISNKKVTNKIYFDGPLTWREIVRTQPEKEEILRAWFNETGNWPYANSTPIFDATSSIVYGGYSLNIHSYGNGYLSTYNYVKEKILNKPCSGTAWRDGGDGYIYDISSHYFVGASDVDVTILIAALENYKKAKAEEKKKEVKKETMEKMLERLHELEEEIKKEL